MNTAASVRIDGDTIVDAFRENLRAGAFGVRRREQHRHRPAFRHADDRRALRPGRIHHGADVLHPLFEGADAHPIVPSLWACQAMWTSPFFA